MIAYTDKSLMKIYGEIYRELYGENNNYILRIIWRKQSEGTRENNNRIQTTGCFNSSTID